jgi:nucleoside-diphosphate-sugar epimerase
MGSDRSTENEIVPVAGGAVFLGSHLCSALPAGGSYIVCVNNLESGRQVDLEEIIDQPNLRFLDADTMQAPNLFTVNEAYHLALRASPADFTESLVRIARTNTEEPVTS